MKIGYARVSTAGQDVAVQREQLQALGVDPARVYTDRGLTGTDRDRPALREAMAACRAGDELVVTKLDRLARSIPDARDIARELEAGGVTLNLGGSAYNPTDPIGKLLFNILALIAEFEADLIRARTREGLEHARRAGRLLGGKPKLTPRRQAQLVRDHEAGVPVPDLVEDYGVSRATAYRVIAAARESGTLEATTREARG